MALGSLSLITALALNALRGSTALTLDMQPDVHSYFKSYTSQFGKKYVGGSEEYNRRLGLFQERLQEIQAHNSKSNRLWTAGVNLLTDWTDDELKQLRGWQRGASSPRGELGLSLLGTDSQKEHPKSVDWRNLSMQDSMVDQGQCGSCWAVATSTMLQGRYEVKKGTSRTFSAQQLVNCVENPRECGGTGGCQGATVELAMDYVQNNPSGLQDAETVDYTGYDGTCASHQKYKKKLSSSSFLARVDDQESAAFQQFGLKGWHKLPQNKVGPLMQAIQDGPVAISVGADLWNAYSSGIFDSCSKDVVVNHAVVLFGYGSDDGIPYWTVRNSWGNSWGESGYIRLLRQDTQEKEDAWCGIDDNPGLGVACKDKDGKYPEKDTVCGMCGILYDSVAAHLS